MRVSDTDHTALTQRAREEADNNVSELMRRMLKYALTNMPKGWHG